MPRPRRRRRIRGRPCSNYFKPAGQRRIEIDEIILSMDEFEAIRLKDFLNLDQNEAAEKMNISQPTFHRLLQTSRKKISEALVKGKVLKII